MNEIRRAGLAQIADSLTAVLGQVSKLLEEERGDIQDLPDNIEDSAFAAQVLKRPMFELAAAKVHLVEALEHIRTALSKT